MVAQESGALVQLSAARRDAVTTPCPPLVPRPPPPVLVLRADEEGSQARALHFLCEEVGLRCHVTRDPLHRDWNDILNAVKRAGMWSAPGKLSNLQPSIDRRDRHDRQLRCTVTLPQARWYG